MINSKESEVLFNQLYKKAEEAATELTRPWFDKSLFNCRSTRLRDYVNEAENTWQQCQQLTQTTTTNSAQYNWLMTRLDQQLNTLVQAFYRGKPPKTSSMTYAKKHAQQEKLTNDLLGLYQQLKTYKEYEVRLGDNLRVVQHQLTVLSQNSSTTLKKASEQQATQQQVLMAQQRLQRCQKAIAAVERAIAKLEG